MPKKKPPKPKAVAATTPRLAKKLTDAASAGKLDEVTTLLERGCDPNVLYQESSALAWAAWKGHTSIVERLLAAGADPNAGKSYPCAGGAMHAAADRGSVEILELLVAAGGDVNIAGQAPDVLPLFRAASHGRADAVRYLLDHGADPHVVAKDRSAMHAAAEGGSREVLELVHARGVALHGGWRHPLHVAVRAEKPEAVQWLLAHGCDANQRDERDPGAPTALHIAAEREDGAALIDTLVAGGASVDARAYVDDEAPQGLTALQVAVERGHVACVERLLHHGADRAGAAEIAQRHIDTHPPEIWGDDHVRILALVRG
jgi:ankyrin repeat protein